MTAHEYARILLEGPDLPLKIKKGYAPHILDEVYQATENPSGVDDEGNAESEPYILIE